MAACWKAFTNQCQIHASLLKTSKQANERKTFRTQTREKIFPRRVLECVDVERWQVFRLNFNFLLVFLVRKAIQRTRADDILMWVGLRSRNPLIFLSLHEARASLILFPFISTKSYFHLHTTHSCVASCSRFLSPVHLPDAVVSSKLHHARLN